MIKQILVYVVTLILGSAQFLIAQGDFSPNSKCEQSIVFLKSNCFTCNKENKSLKCKVEEFKYLGEVSNRFYYSSITLEYDSASGMDLDNEYNSRNVTIYEGKTKDMVEPVYSTGGSVEVFEHVYTTLTSTKLGSFIHIYVYDGNGGWDNGEYFIFRKGNWHKLGIPEIPKSLESIIPQTYSFCRGGVIDFEKMTFNLAVFKKYDGCCCPTGGTARAYLKLTDDNKIIITNKKYFPDLN